MKKGFTLIEILLVVALISILAGIVILAINPFKQLGDTKNAQRRMDVNTILNAVYQYSLDNGGVFPSGIPINSQSSYCSSTVEAQICKTSGCSSMVNLSVLTLDKKYLVEIPSDPTGATAYGTGYNIIKTPDNRITVCAPFSEQGIIISATR